jgi:hypothetical protein
MNINSKYKFNTKGWFKDSWRHMLAAKGIKTKVHYAASKEQLEKHHKAKAEFYLQMMERDKKARQLAVETPITIGPKLSDLDAYSYAQYGSSFNNLPWDKRKEVQDKVELMKKKKYDSKKFQVTKSDLDAVREQARQKMERGDPLSKDELEAFTEYPFPGMQILKFRKVDGGYKMTGGLFGGEPGFEKDLSFEKALEDAKKPKKYQAEKPESMFSWLTQPVKKKKVESYKNYGKPVRRIESAHDWVQFREGGKTYVLSPDNDWHGGIDERERRFKEDKFIRTAPFSVLKKKYGLSGPLKPGEEW